MKSRLYNDASKLARHGLLFQEARMWVIFVANIYLR